MTPNSHSRTFLVLARVPLAMMLLSGANALAQEAPAQEEPDQVALEHSGNSGNGVFHLNQSGGDAGNQDNVLVISSAPSAGAALADANSAQGMADISTSLAGPIDVSMTDVGNATDGVLGINQSAASGSTQSNILALAVTNSAASIAVASANSSTQIINSQPAFPSGPTAVTIADVGNGISGVMQVNQLGGVAGRQSNVVALAAAGEGIALADAASLTSRSNDGMIDPGLASAAQAGTADLVGSFNSATGLVQVNQATGGYNSQSNLVAAAFGSFADASAISESSLGEIRSPVTAAPEGEPAALEDAARMEGSFDGFVGLGQVSQVSGFGNQTANTVSVAVSYGPVGQ